jgi:hypothetical protein
MLNVQVFCLSEKKNVALFCKGTDTLTRIQRCISAPAGYYNSAFGAIRTIGQRMAVLEVEAEILINKYFKNK